jgi:hypothetical protein
LKSGRIDLLTMAGRNFESVSYNSVSSGDPRVMNADSCFCERGRYRTNKPWLVRATHGDHAVPWVSIVVQRK